MVRLCPGVVVALRVVIVPLRIVGGRRSAVDFAVHAILAEVVHHLIRDDQLIFNHFSFSHFIKNHLEAKTKTRLVIDFKMKTM